MALAVSVFPVPGLPYRSTPVGQGAIVSEPTVNNGRYREGGREGGREGWMDGGRERWRERCERELQREGLVA